MQKVQAVSTRERKLIYIYYPVTNNTVYSSVLKYRNLIASNSQIQNQISRKLSRIKKISATILLEIRSFFSKI